LIHSAKKKLLISPNRVPARKKVVFGRTLKIQKQKERTGKIRFGVHDGSKKESIQRNLKTGGVINCICLGEKGSREKWEGSQGAGTFNHWGKKGLMRRKNKGKGGGVRGDNVSRSKMGWSTNTTTVGSGEVSRTKKFDESFPTGHANDCEIRNKKDRKKLGPYVSSSSKGAPVNKGPKRRVMEKIPAKLGLPGGGRGLPSSNLG